MTVTVGLTLYGALGSGRSLPFLPLPDSSSSTRPSQVWLAWPSGGCVPSFWVMDSVMRAWIWWLLPSSCTLSPSPLPGNSSNVFLTQEVALPDAVLTLDGGGWLRPLGGLSETRLPTVCANGL